MYDYQRTNLSPINKSKSKQHYTFPKSPRFKTQNQLINHQIYDLPTYLSKKGVAFGFSKKKFMFPFQQEKKCTPPPNLYNLISEVQLNKKKNKGLIISEKSKAQYYLPKIGNPGPAAYEPKPISKRSISLLFDKSTKKMEFPLKLLKGLESPGPATHSTIQDLNRSFESKFKNNPNAIIGTQQRMPKYSMNKIIPGPNAYQPQKLLNSYIRSKFTKKLPLNFSNYSGRKYKTIEEMPGPGSYHQFSQFGVKYKPYNNKMGQVEQINLTTMKRSKSMIEMRKLDQDTKMSQGKIRYNRNLEYNK